LAETVRLYVLWAGLAVAEVTRVGACCQKVTKIVSCSPCLFDPELLQPVAQLAEAHAELVCGFGLVPVGLLQSAMDNR
jgi:hypothetical protein